MSEKVYRLGILVGRFQTLHLGHEDMIRTASKLCDHVGIFLGSSQESRTAKNPFTFEERRDMLLSVFPEENIRVFPLPDIFVGNTGKWGDYVLENVTARYGYYPDLQITGKEARRVSWFDGEKGASIAELAIPKTVDISASEMRDFLIRGDEASWRKFTNEALWPRYEEMRSIVLSCKDVTETGSI